MYIKESVMIGGKELSIETGKLAKQADGSVVVLSLIHISILSGVGKSKLSMHDDAVSS